MDDNILTMPGSCELYDLILDEHNTLIAGCVGSGKTTLECGLIAHLLRRDRSAAVYLIDPKQFELRHFRKAPAVRGYADTPGTALDMIHKLNRIREARSDYMKHHDLRRWDGAYTYLFIDELADLMTGDRAFSRDFCEALTKLMQLGRALAIKVIALTQQPRREVTPARLQVNFTCNVALHCRSAIESRQVLGVPGAENLPRYGKCLVSAGGYIEEYEVPLITDAEVDRIVKSVSKTA